MSDKKTDKRYLKWYTQRGPAVFGDWTWLNDKFLPATERFKNVADAENDYFLISDSYYKIGDIFFFIDAPLASLKYFRLSIEADPKHAAAYREAGDRLGEMGRYEEAEQYLRQSLKLNPNDELAQADLEDVLQYSEDKNYEPLYTEGDTGWSIDEQLARGNFTDVLSELKTVRKVEDGQRRARAYGGLKQKNNFIDEWDRMTEIEGSIEFCVADWFFMPNSVWNSPIFWLGLKKLKKRFVYGVWPYHESLWRYVVPFSGKKKMLSKSDIERCRKRIFLFIQYQIARTGRDARLIKKLAETYPNWPEANKLNKRLNGSM